MAKDLSPPDPAMKSRMALTRLTLAAKNRAPPAGENIGQSAIKSGAWYGIDTFRSCGSIVVAVAVIQTTKSIRESAIPCPIHKIIGAHHHSST